MFHTCRTVTVRICDVWTLHPSQGIGALPPSPDVLPAQCKPVRGRGDVQLWVGVLTVQTVKVKQCRCRVSRFAVVLAASEYAEPKLAHGSVPVTVGAHEIALVYFV